MNKAIIIEDEAMAAQHLIKLLSHVAPDINASTVIQSIEESVEYFNNHNDADVVFIDIHLSDGLAFHIFEQVNITCPIIFTTTYDQYALEAFKVNSVDYLLKPIKQIDLERALNKIKNLANNPANITLNADTMAGLLTMMKNRKQKYKANFLIPYGEKLIPISVKEIAYFYIDMKITHAVTFDGITHALDKSLDDIIKQLNPDEFYRINRQYIISLNAVKEINVWVGGKLSIVLTVKTPSHIIIPKAKTTEFKEWYTK